ncbi:hypothetical protein RQP46_011273 [Phenoliferia psychrophenolica]
MAHRKGLVHHISTSSFVLIALVLIGIYYLWSTPPPSSSSASHAHPAHLKSPPLDHAESIQTPLQPPASAVAGGAFQKRLVAVADIHGDLLHTTRLLRTLGLLNLKSEWVGGDTILVQTGDIVDRGRDTIALYRLMDSLRAQATKAGGAVVSLLGNHEIMNALGDWRYVTKEDIATFGGPAPRRLAIGEGWIGQTWRSNYSITARVPFTLGFPSLPSSLVSTVPAEFSDAPQTYVGDVVRPRDPNDPFTHAAISYVHGGIVPDYIKGLRSDNPIREINRIGSELMYSVLNPPVHQSLPLNATAEQRLFWSEHGPMWDRTYALDEDEVAMCARAREACDLLGVRRLVMGHTPHFEGPVSRCEGMVLLIDTGISRAYGGAISATEFLFTLTPDDSSSSPVDQDGEEAEDRGLRRRKTSTTTTTRWRESEVVTAWFVGGREKEVLATSDRVVELPTTG